MQSTTIKRPAGRPRRESRGLPLQFTNFDLLPDSAYVPLEAVALLRSCSVDSVREEIREGKYRAIKRSTRATVVQAGDLRRAMAEEARQ